MNLDKAQGQVQDIYNQHLDSNKKMALSQAQIMAQVQQGLKDITKAENILPLIEMKQVTLSYMKEQYGIKFLELMQEIVTQMPEKDAKNELVQALLKTKKQS